MSNKKPIARHLNKVDRRKEMLATGRCPECEIKLISPYHTDCPYLKDIHKKKRKKS